MATRVRYQAASAHARVNSDERSRLRAPDRPCRTPARPRLPPPPPRRGRPRPGGGAAGRPVGRGLVEARFIDAPFCDGCGVPFEFDPGAGASAPPASPAAGLRPRARGLPLRRAFPGPDPQAQARRPDRSRRPVRPLAGARRGDLLPEIDAVAPVPLHPSRLLRRRYNQAAEIARPLARLTGRAYLPDAVPGSADAHPGRPLAAGRRLNVAGAFVTPER